MRGAAGRLLSTSFVLLAMRLVGAALGIASVLEAGGKPLDQSDGPVGGSEQKRAGIRCDRPAFGAGHHGPTLDGCKLELFRATLCRHRGNALS